MRHVSSFIASSTIVLLTACGGGGGGDNGPAGTAGANQPPAPSGFSANLTTSTPANNATKVATNKPISIQFSEAVNPSAATAGTVQVRPVPMDMANMAGMMRMEDSMVEIPAQVNGTITVNGSTLTFTPSEHLENGRSYQVEINNVRNLAGTATAPSVQLQFSTLRNPLIQRIEYDERSPGVVASKHVYDLDPVTGMMRSMTSYDAAGAVRSHEVMMNAQIPGPPPVTVMEVTHTDAAGTTIRGYEAEIATEGTVMIHGEYSGPGVDTLWNKTDDLLDEFTETGPLTAASSNWL